MQRSAASYSVHKSIRIKLFIIFLLTTLLVVVGMYLFMRWSLHRGFTEFIEARQQERMQNFIDELTDYYAGAGSWEPLAGDKRLWIQLLLQSDNHHHRRAAPWPEQAKTDHSSQWPPADFERHKKIRFMPFELRVMLLRADRSIIFGRPEKLDSLKLHPIRYRQNVIGFLGLLPGKTMHRLGEIRFLERQTQAFVWIALLMVALSAGLALLLAYLLGLPIKRIAAAVKELAVGRYHTRLPVESGDELGQLARDFNEMATALEQSEQARRRWVADISHELRTPLALLRAELEALQDGIRPLTRSAVESLFADVMRLNRLTEDLYQLALSDQGALTYRKSSIEPADILKEDLNALRPEFDNKGLSVRLIDELSGPVNLYADSDRLSQLFRNLLHNSINYTDRGDRLEIRLGKKPGVLQIELADSGPGVSEQDLPKLFDRFYRVESSRSRNHGGAGLGLAICANIVAAHHGTIVAQASPLGGLAIRIALPLERKQ